MAVTIVIFDIGAKAFVSLSAGLNDIPKISVRFEYIRKDFTANKERQCKRNYTTKLLLPMFNNV